MCRAGGELFDLSDFSNLSCSVIGPLFLCEDVANIVLVVVCSSVILLKPLLVCLEMNNCRNSHRMFMFSQPYTIGLETADDMAITWQMANMRYNVSAETFEADSGGYITSATREKRLNGSQLPRKRTATPGEKIEL